MSKKIALGLSGGVDSSVCVLLLQQAGYDVTGVYLECFNEVGCSADADRSDAFAIANQLNIPFISLDFKDAYQQKVLDYFYASYAKGQTPNPDLLCNREIKFGLFYDWAMENNFDLVATGHYAKVLESTSHHFLTVPKDIRKDQTYFLSLLSEEKLSRVIFPLADYLKTEVRELAEQNNLTTAQKKDSMGVCFVGKFSLKDFLSKKIPIQSGKVLNQEGEEIGIHQGAASYTIGQRHGFIVNSQTAESGALYVIAKNIENNTIIVGSKEATARNELVLKNFNLINSHLKKNLENLSLLVRVRHTGELMSCSAKFEGEDLICTLEEAAYGVGDGQFGVLYVNGQSLNLSTDTCDLICVGAGEVG
ncbi:MAG: tRNA 2-thiouridine(34) synthase MnmA [Pseudomonadales bacterium]|jgi:tRNA-specific 2-thiouridylase|nr:tRNA 2-thiouridine(34) synthase MnmA [Pseudomonadales bacterium]